MGRHGENIRKRRDGRWEARYMVFDKKKGKKVYRSVYGATYEEAKEKRATIIEFNENPYGHTESWAVECEADRNLLFETAAEEWLAHIKSNQKPSTYQKYSIIYHSYLEMPFGKIPLLQFTRILVIEKQPCKDQSESVKKSIYCVMNRILKYAAEQYAIPLPDVKKPYSSLYQDGIEVFTTAEQARLLSAVYHRMDSYKLAVLLCLYTGLRLGEICALKWSDIDFENRTLSVNGTVQRLYVEEYGTKTALVETEPKSIRSKREIPLQDSIIALFFDFRAGEEYVFGGSRPLEPRTMQNRYKRILEEADVAYKNFHALRHTYATNCIEKGADVKSLSEMLGHSSVQITLNYYVHPSMDTKRRYANSLCAFYTGIHGQIRGEVSYRSP